MARLTSSLLVIAVAACGGSSSSSSGAKTTPGAAAPATLPWEAAMTVGATFTLVDGMTAGLEDEGEPLTIKVTNVEDTGSERSYTLAWSDGGNGLEKIVVRGGGVVFNDVKPEDMQDPYETPIGTCYGEDLSNPDGCDDICDGQICMNTDGIVSVGGLYAPGYSEYVTK
jgi:hypothetical protein